MERPKCKLCFRIFANGRALGGHMKAHLANLKIHRPHVVESITSSPSSSSSGDGEQESSHGDQEIEEKSLIYGLRENPRRSFKCADPEFSFSGGSGFAIVQDRESETESRNPTRRRSKRARRKLGGCNDNAEDEMQRKPMPKPSQPSSPAEPEPVSSVSDTSPEEDVAMCLMMLSRDKWGRKRLCHDDDDDDHEEVQEGRKGDLSGNEAERKHHQCEVCKKVFRSSQALGGHRVIHRKAVGSMGCEKKRQEDERERRDHSSKDMVMARKKEKVYECPFCGRVFGNGQALGGHKRSHLMGLGGRSSVGGNGDGAQSSKSKLSANLIDLNLPAPVEEDDFSVVSDNGEFTQPIEN